MIASLDPTAYPPRKSCAAAEAALPDDLKNRENEVALQVHSLLRHPRCAAPEEGRSSKRPSLPKSA